MGFDLIDQKFGQPAQRQCDAPLDWEEGGPCPLCKQGVVEFAYPPGGCCSCHLTAPCGYCESSEYYCPACNTRAGEAFPS